MTRISVVLFALTIAIVPLMAQTSSLQGTVTDSQGAVVAGTIITATNLDTSATRTAVADETGVFSLTQMAPGAYKLEAKKPGFSTFTSADIRLQVNLPATLNIKLEIGKTTDTVNVEAEAESVNTQNSTVGNPFTEVQVKEIPLQTRNVVALLGIEPGVSSTGQVLGL